MSINCFSLPPTKSTHLTRPTGREWLLFVMQVALVSMVELGNDIIRGNIWRPNGAEALTNAHQIVQFETMHGFFIEPSVQTFFHHAHSFLGLVLTWPLIEEASDNVYAICHLAVSAGVAVWVFLRYRRYFALLRNVILLTNVLALLGYELYPMAPPRLTTGLIYNGHAFVFQDTMRHVLGTGKLNGTPIGYNPLSAMPSLHVAWAIIMGATIVLLARNPILRALGAIYPVVMTFTVVVTANHYIMDAVGAVLAVAAAALLTFGFQWLMARRRHRQSQDPEEQHTIIQGTRAHVKSSSHLQSR